MPYTICVKCLEEYEQKYGKAGSEREELADNPKIAKLCKEHQTIKLVKK